MVEIQSQKVSQLIAFINALMTKFELLIGFIALYLILNSLALITQKPQGEPINAYQETQSKLKVLIDPAVPEVVTEQNQMENAPANF